MTFKKLITITTAAILGFSLIGLTAPAFASDPVCDNPSVAEEVKAASGCSGHTTGTLDKAIINILNGIIAAMGLVAVIFVIIGGVNYMTSTGDPSKVEKAKKTILYALIGMAICVLAFAIVNFVIANVIGDSSASADDATIQQWKADCAQKGGKWVTDHNVQYCKQ